MRAETAHEPAPAQEPATNARVEVRHTLATVHVHRDRRRKVDVDLPEEIHELLGKLVLILDQPDRLAVAENSRDLLETKLVLRAGDGTLVLPKDGRESHDNFAFRRIVLLDAPQEIILLEDTLGAGLRGRRNTNLDRLDRAKLALLPRDDEFVGKQELHALFADVALDLVDHRLDLSEGNASVFHRSSPFPLLAG